ncbi:NAD(P)/FAD-dependent oxidoreductase [Geitlerinema sp. P-1104]|uniref:NAD(P)/FAD-dependent oxidoreductase n=1 Tax=Geitlerinema sp. P-1104 TaxID=2546230 RepID=UPI0014770A12|nr:NAD(P)/FAD-dependent oxidoreductase [Geitlerinema sp. P-1104]NMG57186.1 NAD(P)/FAD-dependent oxidoreductase [Geitlerinema sp. P-1104]
MNRPPSSPLNPRICILGGGFAGLYSALALAKIQLLEQWQIIVIDKTDRFEFSPLLYELISGELEAWEVAPPYLQLLRNERISFYCDHIEAINLEARQIQLRDRTPIAYTYLIIALGLESRVPPHPDVLSFRRLADVKRLNAELERLQHQASLDISIVGAGASGVELACKLADRLGDRHQIHLIHRGSQLLPGFSPQTRKAAERAINKRRIHISLNTNVNAIGHQGDFQLQLQQQEKSFKETSHLVIWTAGTQVNPLIRSLPGGEQGQLPVTPELQLSGYPEVFVLGDLAATPFNNSAQVAYQQAPHLAKNLKSYVFQGSLKPFRYRHLGEMLTLGIRNSVVHSFGITLTGRLGHLIRTLVYIQRLPTLRQTLTVFCHQLKRLIKRQ